jgi:hypothetical protein
MGKGLFNGPAPAWQQKKQTMAKGASKPNIPIRFGILNPRRKKYTSNMPNLAQFFNISRPIIKNINFYTLRLDNRFYNAYFVLNDSPCLFPILLF